MRIGYCPIRCYKRHHLSKLFRDLDCCTDNDGIVDVKAGGCNGYNRKIHGMEKDIFSSFNLL